MTTKFNVWITVHRAEKCEFINDLAGKLLSQGFTVSPLGRSLFLTYVDNPASMLAISLEREPRDKEETAQYDASGIYDEVHAILKIIDAKYLSIIVCASGNCTWNTGNISIEKEREKMLKDNNRIN